MISLRKLALGLSVCGLLAGCGGSQGDFVDKPDGSVETQEAMPGEGIPPDAPTGRALIKTVNGDLDVGYAVVDGHAIMEGDIDLGPEEDLQHPGEPIPRANSIKGPSLFGFTSFLGSPFPTSTIYYVLPTFNMVAIINAMADISAKTDVDFIPVLVSALVPPFQPAIQFAVSNDPGVSSSPVGWQPTCTKIPPLSLPTQCLQTIRIWPSHGKSIVEHEVLHSLGLWHEQQRWDRDAYLNVNLACVPADRRFNYDVNGWPFGPYDLKSIMHYGSYAFSINSSCPAMTKKDGTTFSQSTAISAGDIAAINGLY